MILKAMNQPKKCKTFVIDSDSVDQAMIEDEICPAHMHLDVNDNKVRTVRKISEMWMAGAEEGKSVNQTRRSQT